MDPFKGSLGDLKKGDPNLENYPMSRSDGQTPGQHLYALASASRSMFRVPKP